MHHHLTQQVDNAKLENSSTCEVALESWFLSATCFPLRTTANTRPASVSSAPEKTGVGSKCNQDLWDEHHHRTRHIKPAQP
ncbi:hypothetical protein Leryth_024587 [Lithospermum erythrorhizon]|nr:hypothetical protein Leryth_024587 [Lithospermum erythrorhizon]